MALAFHILFAIGVVLWAMTWGPSIRKRQILFGVTVAEDFIDGATGRSIISRYRMRIFALSIVSLLACGAAMWMVAEPLAQTGVYLATEFVLILSCTWAYLGAHREVRPHAAELDSRRTVVLTDDDWQPWQFVAVMAPFVGLLLVGVVVLGPAWEQIPNRFPIHFNAAGKADRWADKTPWAVVKPLVLGAMMLVLTSAVCMVRFRRQGALRRLPFAVVAVLQWGLALIFSALGMLPLLGDQAGGSNFMIVVLLVVMGFSVTLLIVIAVTMMGNTSSPNDRIEGDWTEDAYWKAGLIYSNPNDPALFVNKRIGIGYTLNFGHRWAIWLTLGFVLFMVAFFCVALI